MVDTDIASRDLGLRNRSRKGKSTLQEGEQTSSWIFKNGMQVMGNYLRSFKIGRFF